MPRKNKAKSPTRKYFNHFSWEKKKHKHFPDMNSSHFNNKVLVERFPGAGDSTVLGGKVGILLCYRWRLWASKPTSELSGMALISIEFMFIFLPVSPIPQKCHHIKPNSS